MAAATVTRKMLQRVGKLSHFLLVPLNRLLGCPRRCGIVCGLAINCWCHSSTRSIWNLEACRDTYELSRDLQEVFPQPNQSKPPSRTSRIAPTALGAQSAQCVEATPLVHAESVNMNEARKKVQKVESMKLAYVTTIKFRHLWDVVNILQT